MALHDKIQRKRATSGPISYKEMSFSIKQPSIEGRTVCGYFAVFNNKDSDSDILIKGCFAKSITDRGPLSTSGNKIAHLWQHQMDVPLGKITKLEETDFGLYFECLYDDIQKANDALTQIKSGTLDKFSIGFQYVWEKMEYDEAKDAFICRELNLYEGSVVTLAANDMTYVAGIKSEQKEAYVASLVEEAEDLLSGLKAKKQYELRQILSKFIALASIEPVDSKKQKLKEQESLEEPKPQKKAVDLTKLRQLRA